MMAAKCAWAQRNSESIDIAAIAAIVYFLLTVNWDHIGTTA